MPLNFMPQKSPGKRLYQCNGVALPLMIPISAVLLLTLVLSEDVLRLRTEHRKVQNVAAALAHGCANRLKGTLYGWLECKREALALLVYNSMCDAGQPAWLPAAVSSGPGDPYETRPVYSSTHFDCSGPKAGGVSLDIQRGAYDKQTGLFTSLEGQVLGASGVEAYKEANAAQVVLTLNTLDLFFTRLLPGGFNQIQNVSITVTAVNEAALK